MKCKTINNLLVVCLILDEYREREELPPVTEDTLEISKLMRASTPPPTAGNDDNIPKRSRPFRRVRNIVISEVEMLYFHSASIVLSHICFDKIYIIIPFLLYTFNYIFDIFALNLIN